MGKFFFLLNYSYLGSWFLASFTDHLLVFCQGYNLSLFPRLVFPALLSSVPLELMVGTWFTLGLSEAYLHLRALSGLEAHMGKALLPHSLPWIHRHSESQYCQNGRSKTEACPQGKIQPAGGKRSICSFIHHIFIKYFPFAKLSARAVDIKSRPISALKDLTVKC